MKCFVCGANVMPRREGKIKYCPKCDSILGTTIKIKKEATDLSYKAIEHTEDALTDKPKDKVGKYQPHLVCASLTRAIARVREYGVLKYHGEDGWKQQTTLDYMDAIGRHYDECRNDPLSRDTESGLLHIAQIATNAMFVIQMLKDQGIDLDSMNKPEGV